MSISALSVLFHQIYIYIYIYIYGGSVTTHKLIYVSIDKQFFLSSDNFVELHGVDISFFGHERATTTILIHLLHHSFNYYLI
jgi:hypothetical protein